MTSDSQNPDTRVSLLNRLRDYQDNDSWESFVGTYGPFIFHFCLRRGVRDTEAVDLVQEVLTQVTVSIRTFEYDPGRGRFRDWLGAVVRSKLARHWRANANAATTFDFDQVAGAALESEWANEWDAHLLRAAMSKIRDSFTAVNWRAFEMTWVEGCRASDVAATLAIPIAQVYVAKSRIAKRLADEVRLLSDDTTWRAGPT